MLKRMISGLLILFFLAACGGVDSQEAPEETQQSEETETEQPEPETEETSKGEGEDTSQEEESDEEAKDSESADETSAQPEEEPKEPQYKLGANWSFEPIADANPQVALITIDDAPDKYGVEMAKTLKEMNAPAIFFVNGHFIDTEEEKEKLKQIHELGFAIGNHTNSHASLPDLTEEQQKQEIVGLNDQIEKVIGERPKFFRAPFGQNTDYSKQLAKEEGMLVMNWTYGYDWNEEYMSADAIADIMVNTELLNHGANLLMHDREWTYNGLTQIVEGLRNKDYELLDPALIQTP
ncbi:polysaccharide deacetylase family protein [Halobacillus litoralis]|uniref:polysaccharide deacetylase family protein n=1 Tax=Halobacillus litoralis TaxID=45668 RepID=UPI001CD4B492|nr:polysaccharide deacetylase family protein [Halobacillus litoralis]MCA0969426.1 polysaccharide deacetylase family protein [Halobacillus litoralis]